MGGEEKKMRENLNFVVMTDGQGQGHVKIELPGGGLEVYPIRDKFKRLKKKYESNNLLIIPVVLCCNIYFA